jgi:hypothetical protein
VGVNVPKSNPQTPQSQAAGRATQQLERDRAARAKERKIRRQEHLDQHNKDYQLRKQLGLSPSPALVISSSDEEEREGERNTSDRWEPAVPPSPGIKGVITGPTLEADTEPPVIGSTVGASAGAPEAPPEPSRKRK